MPLELKSQPAGVNLVALHPSRAEWHGPSKHWTELSWTLTADGSQLVCAAMQSTHGSSNSLGASPSASSSGALFSSRTQSEAEEGSVHSPTSTNGSLPAGVEVEFKTNP